MHRTRLLALSLTVLTFVAGCSLAAPSQPQTAATTPAPATSAAPRATAPVPRAAGGAAKPAAKAVASTGAAKPAGAASPAAATAREKPAVQPSPATAGAAPKPPAVVATSVAGLTVVGAPSGARAEAHADTNAPTDALGVAASAGAVAAANVSDTEATALCGPGAILSTRAGQAAGKTATVAIARVAAAYQPSAGAQPTYLNDAPVPNHVFTAVISGNDRAKFQTPPEGWNGKGLCVTGPVELSEQRPQIVVHAPSQLRAAR